MRLLYALGGCVPSSASGFGLLAPRFLVVLLSTFSFFSHAVIAPRFCKAETKGKHIDTNSAQSEEDQRFGRGKMMTGKGTKGYLAFTFDDGPSLQNTPRILTTLETFGVPATFFVVGRQFRGIKETSKQGAALLLEIAARGFPVGNHTTHHRNLSKIRKGAAILQISENATALQSLLGYRPRLFRPPFGATTPAIRKYLRRRGDTLVRWNIDPQDFRMKRRGKRGAEVLRKRVIDQIFAKSGGILLLHDTKTTTADALPSILQDLFDGNCKRLEQGLPPILPVSLEYFFDTQRRLNDARMAPERLRVHESRHRLQKHCDRKELNN